MIVRGGSDRQIEVCLLILLWTFVWRFYTFVIWYVTSFFADIHQLNLIFGVLGTPSDEDLGWVTNEKALQVHG
jgi:hypothetical protein